MYLVKVSFAALAGMSILFLFSCGNIGQNEQSTSATPKPSITPALLAQHSSSTDHFSEALTLSQKGEYEKAIEEMEKVVRAKPGDVIAYNWMAKWYSVLKKYDKEADVYKRLIEIDPKDSGSRWALAKILVRELGRYEEGLAEAKQAQELFTEGKYTPDQVIGEAYEKLGNNEQALKHYKLFLKGMAEWPESDAYKQTKKKIAKLENTKHPGLL